MPRLSTLTSQHRNVTLAARLRRRRRFPFTQSNDQYTPIGANILIFATVALGLNVVVGLAGLLDLGYVAFLGVGAYAAALVSGSPSSALGVHFPFWAAVLTGAAASLVFGVLIGAPTLRLRGDYLAIVTLGFGEIFRITMHNLDGTSGPDVTNGSNGIPNIPDLEIFGFNLGDDTRRSSESRIGRFANYYLLMLLFTAHRRHGLPPRRRLPHRPRLGRHPRGRDRRPRHGHQRLPRQAHRLRPRRHPRRHSPAPYRPTSPTP